MFNVLYHSLFKANPFGHGGEKRSAQINELFGADKLIHPVYTGKKSVVIGCKMLYDLISIFDKNLCSSLKGLVKFICFFNSQYSDIYRFLKRNEELLIWENSWEVYLWLPYWAKQRSKKIVAFPHNIESLVPGQQAYITRRKTLSTFKQEVDAFRKCDIVFTISREDTHILRLFGVNAHYFPYYPPQVTVDRLLKTREARQLRNKNSQRKILLLGSVSNAPTMDGMLKAIELFTSIKQDSAKLYVAGFGTEKLKSISKVNNERIIYLGTLSSDKLEQEMIETDALLIYQNPTTGALTRIIESIIAGVPVIANDVAARSYYDMDGVYVYRSENELSKLISLKLQMPTLPNKPDCNFVLDQISKI